LISSYSLIYARKKLKINNYEDSLTNQQLKKDFWVQYQEKRRKKKNLSELGEEDVPLIEGFFFFFLKKRNSNMFTTHFLQS
jgi:aminopeptidase C